MAWPSKNHLVNLEEILTRLHWLLQPDTILTELPYDLEFVSQTDIERFTDWCRRSVSKQELETGKYAINKSLIDFFAKSAFPKLKLDRRKQSVDAIFRQLHNILKIPDFTPIPLNSENIKKILDKLNEVPGESHLEKTSKKIKVGVALKWLQDSDVREKLSDKTIEFINNIGNYYGKVKKGECVRVRDIGTYQPPESDITILIEDFELKVELALMEASQEIRQMKDKYEKDDNYGQFTRIVGLVKRLENYINGKEDKDYDYIEKFRDIVFVVIILNYIQDPYIKRSKEAANLFKLTLPIYTKYLEFEGKRLREERKPYV